MSRLEEIINYYRVSDKIATSGQPTKEQFGAIATAGYQAVVNLALPSSDKALADEGSLVTSLGMAYFHLPVVWKAPRLEDVKLFFAVMKAFGNRPVWVHCALNMRVSCFMYLYQKHVLQLSEEQAQYPMNQIWQPEGVWHQLIEEGKKLFV
ncbi:protein tyrosine phosphatase family protein [Pleurocapsales cyanobacterium LEGE 06147]|nr:protein tyrosine phosphatase family protein [Pleurocapsales cyanobacterium LEGE 06147]